MFEELLKNGADVNLNLHHNQTILHFLCQDIKLKPSATSSILPKISTQNSCQAHNFLQAYIRRQNAQNSKIEIKTYESYKEQKNKINKLIQLTMAQRANIYLKNEFNETPLDVAVKYGRIETFDYFIKQGLRPTKKQWLVGYFNFIFMEIKIIFMLAIFNLFNVFKKS